MAIKFPKHILVQDYQEIIFWINKFKELEFLNEDFTLISQDANGKDIDDVLAVSFEQDSESNIIIICGADGSEPYISKDVIKSFSSSANYEKTLFIK